MSSDGVIAEWSGTGAREGFESRVVRFPGNMVRGLEHPYLWLWRCPWHRDFRVYAYIEERQALEMHRQMQQP